MVSWRAITFDEYRIWQMAVLLWRSPVDFYLSIDGVMPYRDGNVFSQANYVHMTMTELPVDLVRCEIMTCMLTATNCVVQSVYIRSGADLSL